MAPNHATPFDMMRRGARGSTSAYQSVRTVSEPVKHTVWVTMLSRSKLTKSGKSHFAPPTKPSPRCLRTTIKRQQILARKETAGLARPNCYRAGSIIVLLTARRREATDCTMVCVSRAADQRDTIVLDGRSFGFSLVWPNSRHGQRGHIPPVRSLVDSGSDGL